ncbi:MAG: peptide-methionine (S)-S-oxide reductase MsrA [Candidatus Omnitrophica bacterium]|nr:peptide-methionine (S)-S-oxide reductase MsrA [Candidatus Omnitrophota bacterium]
MELALFAAGCFWGVEAAFQAIPGVISTEVGYTGGSKANPTYLDVCSGTSGHAEAVSVTYDPKNVSYEQLLAVFWGIHDPTQYNRQGPDIGSQYRSAIFYCNAEQRARAEKSRNDIQKQLGKDRRVTTEILPATTFYRAEDYHQQYLEKRGLSQCRR